MARWLDLGEMPGPAAEEQPGPAGGRRPGTPPVPTAKAAARQPFGQPRRAARGTWPLGSAALVAVAVALWFAFGAAPEALVFDRAAIAAGEWWRLASGHWVHSDASHALLNIAALALIAPIVEAAGRRLLLAALFAGTVAVGAGIVWGMPELARYCGLSGLLNTLFVTALAVVWQRSRQPFVYVFGAALLGKLAWEAANGTSLVVATEWPAVPAAHLAGVLGGGVLLMLLVAARLAAPMAMRYPEAQAGGRAAGAAEPSC